ncbi:hypothetical protein HK097_006061, partial [Rhizophlyctis rosea]
MGNVASYIGQLFVSVCNIVVGAVLNTVGIPLAGAAFMSAGVSGAIHAVGSWTAGEPANWSSFGKEYGIGIATGLTGGVVGHAAAVVGKAVTGVEAVANVTSKVANSVKAYGKVAAK